MVDYVVLSDALSTINPVVALFVPTGIGSPEWTVGYTATLVVNYIVLSDVLLKMCPIVVPFEPPSIGFDYPIVVPFDLLLKMGPIVVPF